MNSRKVIGAKIIQVNQNRVPASESGLPGVVWDIQSIWLDNGWSIIFSVNEGDTEYYVTAEVVNRKAARKARQEATDE